MTIAALSDHQRRVLEGPHAELERRELRRDVSRALQRHA